MAQRFLILLWLPVIWILATLDLLGVFVLIVFVCGEVEIGNRSPLTMWTLVAAVHMAGFLLIMFFPKEEIWFLLSIVVFNDTGAYFAGKSLRSEEFRKHPFPKISPNKTVGGYICGFVAGTAAGVAAANHFHLPTSYQLLALLICVFAIAGDLAESKFKRFYGIKDSGEDLSFQCLLFGHGGIYDRFDAISMACIGWFCLKLIFI